MKITKIEFDGKFTVTYDMDDGTSSGFRVVPELGRMIGALPAMMDTLQILADGHYCEGDEREMAQTVLKEARGESESEYTLNGEPFELDVFLGQNMFTVKELHSIRDMKRGESLIFEGKLLRRII